MSPLEIALEEAMCSGVEDTSNLEKIELQPLPPAPQVLGVVESLACGGVHPLYLLISGAPPVASWDAF